ncbi:MAG: CoA-binding protein [Thermoplasmata archaeon]|nr:MAG: CoA-binding protein [Thermoplasmata archaeon]
MDKFFSPASVAIIGASAKKGKIGYQILENVLKSGAKVYPVNPKRREISGIKCYKSVDEIRDDIDLAVIAIEAEKCIEALEECGKKGIKNVIIISGGFKEIGREDLEKELKKKTKKYGLRIIGPNCIGVFNGKNGFNTFFQQSMDLPSFGNIAILTQSGTFGIALLEKLANENLGVSKFVSYGNKVDVDEVDLIEYLMQDNETEIIAMYIEDIRREFFERDFKKPVIILKAGRSKLGLKAASLHTGAMATNYEIFKGACKQKNVIFANNFNEFFGIIKIIAMQGLPNGNDIDIITNGAGPSVLACDFIGYAKYVKLARNVIDLTGSATAEDYLKAIDESNASIILLTFVFQDAPLAESLDKLYEGLEKRKKFYLALALGGKFVKEQEKKLAELKIPVFDEPSVVISCLDKVVGYAMRK